ncbi:MAG: tRNA (N6-threonylcarbamoyladenosine(37)-N6)-methyltransferase TrmO [Prevotella sp.]|nr:tRNA (N6-threonylcarbamoyladenosine(37)-N6)-methyltransferase TrmO [Prevotella sp.]
MQIEPIARFHSPLTSKFGVPRQGGLATSLQGQIVFKPAYRQAEAVRGLESFSHLWLIWGFSANRHDAAGLTVRPPRLGGNERVGVFASRSPFRPNGLGLTCVHIINIEMHPHLGPVIHVQGADLMDGTPIYDVKPYVRYADSHPEAQSGFVDEKEWKSLEVDIPQEVAACFTAEELQGLREVLSLDPRPQYHHDAERIYGMPYAGRDVRFKVADGKVQVIGQTPLRK